MKLSEAIRLGSLLRPHGFGRLKSEPGRGHKAATCALGAAADALGLKSRRHKTKPGAIDSRGNPITAEYCVIIDPWPVEVAITLNRMRSCPCDHPCEHSGKVMWVGEIIPHLNDTHRWTRERIAQWVEESVEFKYAAPDVGQQISK